MKAIRLIAYGKGAEGVEVADLPDPPEPVDDQVLVAVEYAPVNANELVVIAEVYDWKPALPSVIGNEGAGVIIAVGENARPFFKVGDRVVLPFASTSWRQKLLISASNLTKAPQDVEPEQLSMMNINPVTADMLLSDHVELKTGDAIVFNFASSAIGVWIVALAAIKDIKTIGLVRSLESASKAFSSGCDHVIRDDDDFEEAVAKLPKMNIRLALDGVGGASATRLLQLISKSGTFVAFGGISRQPIQMPSSILTLKNITVKGYFEGFNRDRISIHLQNVLQLASKKKLKQPFTTVFTFHEAKEAIAEAWKGKKVLLKFNV